MRDGTGESARAIEDVRKDSPDPDAAAETPATFELGDRATLGSYTFATPAGWTSADMKDNKLAAMYRSQDKAAVIRVQVRPKAAVTPEACPNMPRRSFRN